MSNHVLGAGDPSVNKIDKNPCSCGAYNLVSKNKQ